MLLFFLPPVRYWPFDIDPKDIKANLHFLSIDKYSQPLKLTVLKQIMGNDWRKKVQFSKIPQRYGTVNKGRPNHMQTSIRSH